MSVNGIGGRTLQLMTSRIPSIPKEGFTSSLETGLQSAWFHAVI